MKSNTLVLMASLLVVVALVVAYWGWLLSLESPQIPAQTVVSSMAAEDEAALQQGVVQSLEEETRANVVVLARDVAAFTVLSEDDFVVERLRLAPPESFSDPAELVGATLWRDLAAGTVLNRGSFLAGGPLARMIRPGERALAIAIDDVIGGGGHLRPGDYVDVLLYLSEDARNADRTMQVVVPALRVLSVGEELGMTLSGEAALPRNPEEEPNRQTQRQAAARNAVLAVPEGLVTRLGLATQVGVLRLAIRSADEGLLARYHEADSVLVEELNQQLFQFERLAVGLGSSPLQESAAPGIPVHRGAAVTLEVP